MNKEKIKRLKEIELQTKAEHDTYIETLKSAINNDIAAFKQLPLEQRAKPDIAKIAFQKVGAVVWFSTSGLTE